MWKNPGRTRGYKKGSNSLLKRRAGITKCTGKRKKGKGSQKSKWPGRNHPEAFCSIGL
jgi:hypothetical protein